MGYQVIKQPDGHLAVFSSYTDTIVVYDATREEIIEWFVALEAQRARESATRVVEYVERDQPRQVYYQFAMTWDEALKADEAHGGEVWQQCRT